MSYIHVYLHCDYLRVSLGTIGFFENHDISQLIQKVLAQGYFEFKGIDRYRKQQCSNRYRKNVSPKPGVRWFNSWPNFIPDRWVGHLTFEFGSRFLAELPGSQRFCGNGLFPNWEDEFQTCTFTWFSNGSGGHHQTNPSLKWLSFFRVPGFGRFSHLCNWQSEVLTSLRILPQSNGYFENPKTHSCYTYRFIMKPPLFLWGSKNSDKDLPLASLKMGLNKNPYKLA